MRAGTRALFRKLACNDTDFSLGRATVTNVWHLLYPQQQLQGAANAQFDRVHAALCELSETVNATGRSYGGGLVKVEPRELEAVPLPPGLVDQVGAVINPDP